MNLAEYASYDGMGLAALVEQGAVTQQELADLANAAIDKLNPILNFMASREADGAVAAKEDEPDGDEFYGVPFLLKAGTAMKGHPLNMGSRFTDGIIAPVDDEYVLRCRKAGLKILGSTTAPEFGNSPTTEALFYGPTLNPWNTGRMVGGSSGGAAAAVASGALPIAMASDGGGSIRTPAHCCGLFGMKPTRARTPSGPRSQGGFYGLGIQHVLTRTVRDSAAMLDVLQGAEPGAHYDVAKPERPYLVEASTNPKPLRIAFSTENPAGGAVHPDCVEGVHEAMKACADLGHQVEEKPLPYSWAEFAWAFKVIWSVGFPFSVTMLEQATGKSASAETLETCNLATLRFGLRLTIEDIGRAMFLANKICREIAQFHLDYDVFVSPTDAFPAVAIGEIDANAADLTFEEWFESAIEDFAPFAPVFNLTGQPAMSVPLRQSRGGLPVGVQFAGRHGDEATLFQLAGQLEAAMPWSSRIPSISVF